MAYSVAKRDKSAKLIFDFADVHGRPIRLRKRIIDFGDFVRLIELLDDRW